MFRLMKFLLLFAVFLSAVEYVYSDECSTIRESLRHTQCISVPQENYQTCVTTSVQDTSNMTWFQAHSTCRNNSGRLVQLYDNFNSTELRSVLFDLKDDISRNGSHQTYIIRTGLLLSIKGDNKTFWRAMENDNNANCSVTRVTEKICSTVNSEEQCSYLGCCMNNQTCVYPGIQTNLVRYSSTGTAVDISGGGVGGGRQCVGLIRHANASDWQWKAFNCSEHNVNVNTTVISPCEYRCSSTWPVSTGTLVNSSFPQYAKSQSSVVASSSGATTNNDTKITATSTEKSSAPGTQTVTGRSSTWPVSTGTLVNSSFPQYAKSQSSVVASSSGATTNNDTKITATSTEKSSAPGTQTVTGRSSTWPVSTGTLVNSSFPQYAKSQSSVVASSSGATTNNDTKITATSTEKSSAPGTQTVTVIVISSIVVGVAIKLTFWRN